MSVISPNHIIETLAQEREVDKREVLHGFFNKPDMTGWDVAGVIGVEETLIKIAVKETETIGVRHLALLCLEKVVFSSGPTIETVTITPYVDIADTHIASGNHGDDPKTAEQLAPLLERMEEFDRLIGAAWNGTTTNAICESVCRVIDAYLSKTSWLAQYLAERILERLLMEKDGSIASKKMLSLLKRHVESNPKIDATELKLILDRLDNDAEAKKGINLDSFENVKNMVEQTLNMDKRMPDALKNRNSKEQKNRTTGLRAG